MQTFQLEDQLHIKRQGDAQISPDGRTLVYVLQYYQSEKERFLRDLYCYDLDTGLTKPLTSGGNNHSPRFSPDGTLIAFLSTRDEEKSQIYLLDLVTGGEARRLETIEAVDSFCWSADGMKILFSAVAFPFADDESWQVYPGAPARDAEQVKKISIRQANSEKQPNEAKDKKAEFDLRIITRFSYRRDRIGYFGHNRSQNFLLTLPDLKEEALKPQVCRLTGGDWDHPLGSLSPDGRWLCVAALHVAEPELDRRGELWLYPTDGTGEAQLLLEAPGPLSDPLWSPQGDVIAFGGHDNRHGVSTTRDLYLLPLHPALDDLHKGSTVRNLSWSDVLNLTQPFDRPYGSGGSSDIHYESRRDKVWLGNALYFMMARHGAGYLYRYDQESSEPVVGSENRSVAAFAVHPEMLVIAASATDTLEELILVKDGQERRISAWNEKYYQERSWARTEKRYFTCSDDGQPLEGWLTYPIEFDEAKRYPLVHLVHGGPHGAYGPAFSFAAQFFAAQGYFVMMMNPRGSTSYGQQFACCIDGDWGNRDAADVLASLDDALSTGYIEPSQCYLHGWSYGGYMACWLTTQTTRYRAICSGAPVSDLRSDYGTADITMANEWEYGGTPWRDADGLLQRSALAHVEKVQTPLLMLHGEADLRCPIIQTEQFYMALKRLGKTVVMVRYPSEFHGLRKPINILDRYERILAWFEYYRKN